MIKRQQLINKLRELGYSFKRQADRVDLWKKIGGTHRALIPRRDLVSEPVAQSILRQCGCTEAEIASFIRAAKA